MAQNDVLKRYIDAGLAFTALTQARAEALVKDLVKVGEVQADQAREAVADLLERSRKNSEKLLETVRTEVRQQITSLGLASQADLDRIEQRIASVIGTATAPAMAAAQRRRGPRRSRPRRRRPRRRRPQEGRREEEGARQEGAAKRAPPRRRRRPEPLARRRLDAELVRRGLAPSRQQAQADIAAGRVTVGGAPADKAARLVAPGEPIRVLGPGAAVRGPGRREARRRARPGSRSRWTAGAPTTSARRPAGSPTASCSEARRRWSRSTSATASCTSACAPTRVSRSSSAPTSATWCPATWGSRAELVVADLSFISLRTVLPAVLALTRARCRPRAPREAPVRGGAGGSGAGARGDHRPDGVAAGARGGGCRARAAREPPSWAPWPHRSPVQTATWSSSLHARAAAEPARSTSRAAVDAAIAEAMAR